MSICHRSLKNLHLLTKPYGTLFSRCRDNWLTTTFGQFGLRQAHDHVGNGNADAGEDNVQCSEHKRVSVTDIKDIQVITESNVYTFLNKYDNFLLDCDGVLWGTDHFTHFPHVASTIEKLRAINKKLFFVTNNSLHCRDDYIHKFRSFVGFDADKSEVFSVAYAAALYLKHIANMKGRCYMIGSPGMEKELDELEIAHSGFGPDTDAVSEHPEILKKLQPLHEDVEAVLVGFDIHFNYSKLYKAASYLVDKNCHYICTSELERSIVIGPKQCQPVLGPIVSAVTSAAKRSPLVIGKPGHHLLECILKDHPQLDLKRTIMIGDSLRTDIAFAQSVGIDSGLVLTGASTIDTVRERSKLPQETNEPLPNYILSSLCILDDFI